MASLATTRIYVALRNREERSHIEDQLVLDHGDVLTFPSAQMLWDRIQGRPARFIITDRRFGEAFDGLELVRRIRKHFTLPYVYILMRSTMDRIAEIEEGLDAGVDGYLIKPHNPFQIRSQLLVGLRWLTYIDSLTWKDKGATSTTGRK
jgi:DNA-binding response OmpR family regulator